MTEVTKEMIYEVLKQIQAGLAEIRTTIDDHSRHLLRIREQLNGIRGGRRVGLAADLPEKWIEAVRQAKVPEEFVHLDDEL